MPPFTQHLHVYFERARFCVMLAVLPGAFEYAFPKNSTCSALCKCGPVLCGVPSLKSERYQQ